MIVKSLNSTTRDVFFGDKGWEDWARIVRIKGHWKQIKGSRGMPENILAYFNKKVTH